ncbi:hypothetical protein AURDEDRAFT_188696 [Auricularia subglabra TFB-10046 SS5]|uniref:F-box domain-containing protein n=1 Tax=Auricularia subglabra (strain TFB-10046 / SS5) TaxID=717982 RepID=J0D8I2_AURST|nr:hypothetical protein AURDEDRAFT_188696 [Auricularia subglabra TFB-10046 SS5]
MLDGDVLLQVFSHLAQTELARVALASRWFYTLAQPILFHHPRVRGLVRARSLATTIADKGRAYVDNGIAVHVKSLHLSGVGAGETTVAFQWEQLQDALVRALRTAACTTLESFRLEVFLPTAAVSSKKQPGWGEVIWTALSENCHALRWVEVDHNAFTAPMKLARIRNLRGLTLRVNLPNTGFDVPAEDLLKPLEESSPGLERLELDLRRDFVYPIHIDDLFERTWPNLRSINLSWGYYDSTMCDFCDFLERHRLLESLTIRGVMPPRITPIAADALPNLRAFDGDMDVAQCILSSPTRSVEKLATWTWDLDTIVDSLQALPKTAVSGLRELDIKFVAHMEVPSGVTGAALRSLAAAAPVVEVLTLRGNLTGEWGWPAYRDALADFRKLRSLAMATPIFIGGMPLLTSMNELASRLPDLADVNLAVGAAVAQTTVEMYGRIAVRRLLDT